jgi:hypothetical protein
MGARGVCDVQVHALGGEHGERRWCDLRGRLGHGGLLRVSTTAAG